MSATAINKRLTASNILAMKGERPVVVLTAYTAPIAKILDQHCDVLLVGDSLGMVVYGMESTVGVTMDMMVAHGKAVVGATKNALIVVDMPFGSYQESKEQAFRNASRLMMETGCGAVKLEGGEEMAETVEFLIKRGIPVMGHVGMTPQAVNTLGGYHSLGRKEVEAEKIKGDARAIEDAGAFSFVIEGTLETLARDITENAKAVTIGIGGSPACDGQVLVVDDMLGLFTDFKPRFVKRFASIAPIIDQAVADYAAEVKARTFPAEEHTYQMKKMPL